MGLFAAFKQIETGLKHVPNLTVLIQNFADSIDSTRSNLNQFKQMRVK